MRILREAIKTWKSVGLAAAATLIAGCAHTDLSKSSDSSSGAAATTTTGVDVSSGQEARTALNQLTASNEAAAKLAKEAVGVLVFPSVTKAGFMVGGYRGDGVLLKNDQVSGRYRTTGASYGFQAGVQKYGYALFFMSDRALRYADETQGWEVGVGPSVVIVDEGKAKTLTSTTVRDDVYAFVFDQKGLMAGMGLQGSKISRIQ